MGECDPAAEDRVVARHVGIRIPRPVLELDLHAGPELLDVERARGPVDAELLADGTRIVRRERLVSHSCSLPSSVKPAPPPRHSGEDDLAARGLLVELADADDLLDLG